MKIIAIIAMIIDHIGLGIWYRLPFMGYLVPDIMDQDTWWSIYRIMRNIGRIAFPLFCFLLVEGFFHTGSRKKYAFRLFAFALISQLPFHYAFSDLYGVTDGLNVFFTLVIGFIAIWGMHEVKRRVPNHLAYLSAWLLIAVSSCVIAVQLDTDYDFKGVVLIIVLYIFHKSRIISLIIGYFSFKWVLLSPKLTNITTVFASYFEYIAEDYCFPGFILASFYNGKRGLKIKYLFYLIYPIHLLLIFIIWNFIL
ncbi:MAG: conjugal transfer protein TraX [Lachnospiraceae bacterium]|nr:conjugal transfer protein TraX [Lachnospiraceae bacterium]